MSGKPGLQSSIFHKLSSLLWGLAVTAIVILAAYVSFGRLLSTNLHAYQEEVLAELNSRLPFRIEARELRGEWYAFTPEIVLSDLTLMTSGEDGHALDLSGGRIGLDVFASLSTRSLQITALQLDDLALQGELTADGRFILPGLTGNGGAIGEWLREFLLNIEYVTLRENSLHLKLPNGEERQFDLNLHLAREGSTRRVSATLDSTRGVQVEIVAKGVGNPFRPEAFSGEVYLDVGSGDLGAVKDMLANSPGAWMEGSLVSEWWLSWDRGVASVDANLRITDALVRPDEGEWSLPLDELSMQASLVERKKHWTLFASNIMVSRGEAELAVPHLQLDAWGESLRVRVAELSLQPLNQLALAFDALPPKVAEVFEILQPSGSLPALALRVGNIAAPAEGWDIEANFEGVDVQSWKGAPGVTAANGYLELSRKGGYVVLDSQQFTMDFPTIYKQPLYYDDFHGTLNLYWDSEALVLDSGVITAQAAEGKARALFRLNIPFTQTDTGLEMDLLVGLANSHPVHRVKYVPYTLNPALLGWLSGAVGEGQVEQAAFLWRGSLRPKASDLRTVQLFLNVANTALDYHPQWPAVQILNGVVLIDDTSVSVWADSARLHDSVAERLSAEAWLGDNNQMLLAVDGRLNGPAADGLAVVNESLLGELAGGAFSEWQAKGDLETSLKLELNLTDKTVPPIVDLHTRWQGVDLDVYPGRIPFRALGGVLSYNSASGFTSTRLKGQLWGRPVSAQVSQQQLPGAAGGMDFGNSRIRVALDAPVAMSSVQDWLGLDALEMAQGTSDVHGSVELYPGEKPRLQLDSDLQGVALDLPPPWSKPAGDAVPFSAGMYLGAQQGVLDLGLGEDLALRLDITGGSMQGASLGIAAEPAPLLANTVLVKGRAPLVDVPAWEQFITRYLIGPSAEPEANPVATAPGSGIEVRVEELQADRLLIWGRDVSDVNFNLQYTDTGWQVDAATEWARGSYYQPVEGLSALDIEFLEMSGFSQLVAAEPANHETAPEFFQLPQMTVEIEQLSRNGSVLGNLDFFLGSEGRFVRASEIRGALAGMELPPEKPASLDWDQGGETRLAASMYFSDFGQTLQALGYEKFLETEQGRLDLDLSWPGSPQDFALAGGSGSVLIDAEAGSFLETPAGATGALRVVGVLNLAGVVQSLSMSQMFDSGIPFHTMDGEVFLHGGTIEVARIDVKGSSSGFSISGVSDVASRSLDGELVATLPVANNLPWVAALTAGLPVAAGVFVVSKLFEKQVNRLSSAVYSISGTWDEPVVKFDRIFDDETRKEIRELADPNSAVTDPNELIRALEKTEPSIPDPNSPEAALAPVVSPSHQMVPDPNQPVSPSL